MRQRVMIAIALACRPPLVIADEPTTALDVTIQAQVLEMLAELKQRFNLALLLITHDFGVIAEMADRVAVMRNGQLVEQGPVRQILREPTHDYTRRLLSAVPGMSRR
jgi:ABC-type dipeptide/oligopeptide/nickel transport system ATPase component